MSEITRDELIQLLTQLAARDLQAGASIYDHPCSVAIREIQSLDAEANKWATAYRQAKESAQETQSQLTAANARVEALEDDTSDGHHMLLSQLQAENKWLQNEHVRVCSSESKLQAENARLKEEAKKQIRRACSNAVEKLNEFAPGMGWDSGDTVAEGYIKALAAEKGEKS